MNSKLVCLIFAYLSFALCLSMQLYLNLDAILSSAIVGLLGSFSKLDEVKQTIYTVSFVAMSSFLLKTNYLLWAITPLLTTVFYFLCLKLFNGFGGKLGTIAFISSGVIYLIFGILQ